VLDSGGYAVATGGGLAVVSKSGDVRVVTSFDGLPDTRVHTVVESADGLWVGTESGAALVTTTAGQIHVTKTVGAWPVRAIASSTSGLVLGTWGSGVFRLATKDAPPSLVPTAGPGRHVAAVADRNGTLFVAHADGPMTTGKDSLRPLPGLPSHGQALATVGSQDGERLLLGDLEGLFEVDSGRAIASVDTRSIAGDGAGLLVGTFGTGGQHADRPGGALRTEPGLPRYVRGVATKGERRCAATSEGLFVAEGRSGWRSILASGPPSNDVTALAARDGRVAIGTFDGGAAVYESGAFRRITGLEPDETVNAMVWAESRLWLGTAHGLVRVENGAATRRLRADAGLPSSVVRALLPLAEGGLLVGTDGGAAIVDEAMHVTPLASLGKGKSQPIESPMHATWALARADDGTLFVGTANGLYYGKGGAWRRASVATGELADDWVTAIFPRGKDVYVGTYSGGVMKLGLSASKPTSVRLGGGYVNPNGLVVRERQLLASTMDGLLVRSLEDDHASWRTRADVTPGRDVTAASAVGDDLWVTSRRGIGVTHFGSRTDL
jgi:ligand-binding sensor domain-containing protein